MAATLTSTLTDTALLRRIANADHAAFETLYDRYEKRALSLAMLITGGSGAAEEATQDAFIGVWRSAHRYDPRRGNPRTWLLALVRNRSIDAIRRGASHARNVSIDETSADQLTSPEDVGASAAERLEGGHVRGLVDELPDSQRQAIELTYFVGLSQSQIARELRLPLGTVKSRQRLALSRLREALTADTGLDSASREPLLSAGG